MWKKYCTVEQATDDNTAHAHCMLDTKPKNTHNMQNLLLFHCNNGNSNVPHCYVIQSLARPGRKQTNASVRMAWISFGALPCRAGGGGPWWQLAARCCLNRARPWHASELVSLLVGLRTYQNPRYVHCLSCYVLSAVTSCVEAFNGRRCIHGRNRTLHAVFTPTQITQTSQYLSLDKRRIVPEKEHFWAEVLLISHHHLVLKDTNWTHRFNSEYSADS